MRAFKALIILIMITGLANAESDYTLKLSDFFGVCDYEKVREWDLYEVGVCTGNFIKPSIELNLLTQPFITLYDNITNVSDLGEFLGLISDFLTFFVNFGINMLRFILHFLFRFALVYLIWISLLFQVLINFFDKNKVLQHEEKIQYTFILLTIGTLYSMFNGLGVYL